MPNDMISPHDLNNMLSQKTDFAETMQPRGHSGVLRLLAALDRALFDRAMEEIHCEPGEIVCREGEMGDDMYLIWSGRVIVFKGDPADPTILGFRGAGEIIGEMALLENQPRSATNVVIEPSRLLRIERRGFQAVMSQNPELGQSLMATLSARLREAGNAQAAESRQGRQLIHRVHRLEDEKQELIDLQRVREETTDLIVHDLRNPLGIIAGSLNMLELVLPPEDLQANRELLDLALMAADRMQRLVDSLLDVAKLESGEMPLNILPTNIAALLKDVADRQGLAERTRGISFAIDTDAMLPIVQADRDMLERVLTNLVDNALKYTPDESTITLAARQDGVHVVISVIDMGPGIPENERQRVFERFAQVDGQRVKRRGFGLGLTFCKLAVEAHGGSIWVEVGPNDVGSNFSFSLPLD